MPAAYGRQLVEQVAEATSVVRYFRASKSKRSPGPRPEKVATRTLSCNDVKEDLVADQDRRSGSGPLSWTVARSAVRTVAVIAVATGLAGCGDPDPDEGGGGGGYVAQHEADTGTGAAH